ncbi:MAG: helix-hairpin-helix domain-containing protein [Promethearchaeota archaeon]
MTKNLTAISGIGKSLAEKMEKTGITSIEKLASIKIEDLLKIKGIGKSTGQKYIESAKELLKKEGLIKNRLISSESVISKEQYSFDKVTIPKETSTFKQDLLLKRSPPKKKKSFKQKSFRDRSKKEKIEQKLPIKKSYHKKTINSKGTQTFKKRPIIIKNIPKSKKNSDLKIIRNISKKEEFQIASSKSTFFQEETMQRIRILHFKIKKLETALKKQEEKIPLDELNNILEYVKILNVNYKNSSQIKMLKELDITPSFFDPLELREIKIWDFMFECARVLWVSAQLYSYVSAKYEIEKKIKYAVVCMVECSKMYKTAAYFSAACTRQEDLGSSLSPENLEYNSEEARLFAQKLAISIEEEKENYALASKLYAGLSVLSRRLSYLKSHDKIKERLLEAQTNYNMGNACQIKAKYLMNFSRSNENYEKIKKYKKKANYMMSLSRFNENYEEIKKYKKKANFYFLRAEEIWKNMKVKECDNILKNQLKNLNYNLSVVNQKIIENDVDVSDYLEVKKIQDPEPIIAVPENLAHFLPRSTINLTKYSFRNLEFKRYEEFKKLRSEMNFQYNDIKKVLNKKAAIGRTIQELKKLYEENDIDIIKYAKLLEKYSNKLHMIENVIETLRKNDNEKSKEREKGISNKLIGT